MNKRIKGIIDNNNNINDNRIIHQFRSAGLHHMKQTLLTITIEIYQEQKRQLHKEHPPSWLAHLNKKHKRKDRI